MFLRQGFSVQKTEILKHINQVQEQQLLMVGIYGEKDLRGHQKSNGSIKVKNMKYIIQVSELLASRLEIEAETSEEAIQKVKDKYYDSDIVLEADDYVDSSVQFEVVDEI